MTKKIKLTKLYIVYTLSILALALFFIADVFGSIVNGVINAYFEIKYDFYWNTRKLKSEIKMLDLS